MSGIRGRSGKYQRTPAQLKRLRNQGFQKKRAPWNKNKHWSKKYIRILSESHKGKSLSKDHKLCCKCSFCKAKRGDYQGKNHWNYKDGRTLIIRYCKCGNKLKRYNSKTCKACALKCNPMKGRHHTKKTKVKIRKNNHDHHIYLIQNSDKIIKLSPCDHMRLHHQAYVYIYEKFGEIGIDDYLRWYKNKYGLKIKTAVRSK